MKTATFFGIEYEEDLEKDYLFISGMIASLYLD